MVEDWIQDTLDKFSSIIPVFLIIIIFGFYFLNRAIFPFLRLVIIFSH